MSTIKCNGLLPRTITDKRKSSRHAITQLKSSTYLKADFSHRLNNLLSKFDRKDIGFDLLVQELYQLLIRYDFDLTKESLLKRYSSSSDLLYLDKIVTLLWTNPTSENFTNLQTLVSEYIYNQVDAKKKAVKRISELTQKNYHRIMDPNEEIPFGEIYSIESLKAVCSYLWIFSDYLILIPEIWNLLDNSLVYVSQLYRHLSTQIDYYDALVENESNNCSRLLYILKKYQSDIKTFIHKFPNWGLILDLNPEDPDQYRIYYEINSLLLDFNIGSPQKIKLVDCPHFSAHQSIIHLLSHLENNMFTKEIFDSFIYHSQKVMSQLGGLISENYVILDDVNTIIQTIPLNMDQMTLNQTQLFNDWITTYLSRILHTLNLLNDELKYYDLNLRNGSLDKNDLGKYYYILVNIRKNYRTILNSFRIINSMNHLKTHFMIDVGYLFRNVLISVLKYLTQKSIHQIVSSSEIMALTMISFNLIEKMDDNELREFQIEHDLDLLNQLMTQVPNQLWSRIRNLSQIKVPDEFLDPITNQEIMYPVLLPQTGQILDRKVILHILRQNPRNPFNLMPLRISELEDFNSQTDVQRKIKEFKIRKLNIINSMNNNHHGTVKTSVI